MWWLPVRLVKLGFMLTVLKHAETNFQESAQVSELMLGKGIDRNGAGATLDELSFHTKARHESWINATYNSQVPDNNYINYGNFAGPPLFEDLTNEIFGKKRCRDFQFYPHPCSWRNRFLFCCSCPRASRSMLRPV